MYEQQIDTNDIDRLMEKKKNDALLQLYREIVNQVEILVNTGQISSYKQNNGIEVNYVSFNVGDMPSFRMVFPFSERFCVCKSVSPTYKMQTQEAINRLKQLCVDKKIEIEKCFGDELLAQYS